MHGKSGVALLLAMPLSAQVSWSEIGNRSIERFSTPIVVDDAGVVWSFGGYATGGGAKNETRCFDGEAWSVVPTATVPPPRADHGLVYDSARDRLVMFGGRVSVLGTPYGDTWEFDGVNWTQVSSAGPAPRSSMAMAYDPVIGATVMHGGRGDSSDLQDTWLWDGVSWTIVGTSSPSGERVDGVAVFHDGFGQVVMYGGYDNVIGPFGFPSIDYAPGLWRFDGSNWTQAGGTVADRYDHSMAYDPASDALHVIGGIPTGAGQSHSVLQGGVWTELAPLPDRIGGGSAVYVDATQEILVTAAITGQGETLRYANSVWSRLQEDWPETRVNHAMTVDHGRESLVLFGGNLPTEVLDDTWEWDGTTWTQHAGGSGPPARSSHSLTYHSASGKSVLFGGADQNQMSVSDTWTFDGAGWQVVTPAIEPPPRILHRVVDDTDRGVLVAFGGATPVPGTTVSLLTDETWEFDGTTWQQITTPTTPGARFYHAMAFVPSFGTVMFGGTVNGFPPFDRTWLYDGTNWTALPVAPPTVELETPSMVWDPQRERLVLHGYESTDPLVASTWELLGSVWERRVTHDLASGPMVYDPRSRRTLTFGNWTYGSQFWSFGADDPASAAPFGTGCVGSNGLVLTTTAANLPWLESTFRATVEHVAPGATPFLAFSLTNREWSGIPLPFDLGLFGASGCTVWSAFDVVETLSGTPLGWELEIPNKSLLLGWSLYVQSVAIDVGANPFGIVTGNALELTLGAR